jgi:hypothetical protein
MTPGRHGAKGPPGGGMKTRVRKTSPQFYPRDEGRKRREKRKERQHNPFSFLHPSDFPTDWFDTVIYCNPRNMDAQNVSMVPTMSGDPAELAGGGGQKATKRPPWARGPWRGPFVGPMSILGKGAEKVVRGLDAVPNPW